MARKKISETMPEATTEEQVLQESVKQEKEEKLIQLASTQMWSPIKDLRDGIIVTKDGRYVQLLEFSPINFELRPEGDKIHIADRFGSALTLFPNKFQIKVLSKKANVDNHIRDIQSHIAQEINDFCRVMQEESMDLARENAQYGISRRFIVSYEYLHPGGLRKPAWRDVQTNLRTTANRIADALVGQPCGNVMLSELGNSEQVMEILYDCMCRSEAENRSLGSKLTDIIYTYINDGRLTQANQLIPVNDIIAPKHINPENAKYLEVDGKYYAFGYIERRSYPQECLPGWVSNIITLGEGIDVDFFVEKVPTEKVNQKLTYSMRMAELNLRHADATSQDSIDQSKKLDAGMYLRQGLSNGDCMLYFSTMLTIVADSPEELRAKTEWVKGTLSTMNIKLKMMLFHHDEAFKASLPLNKPLPGMVRKARRNILSSDFGAFYPFTSYEINDSGGILVGYNAENLSPVYLNPFDRNIYENGNIVELGTSGAGKSYLLMLMAMRLRQQQVHTIIIAPDKGHEFRRSCKAIGGQFISLAPGSKQTINIMEIRKYDVSKMEKLHGDDYSSGSILAAKMTQLHTFFSLILPDMTHQQKQILDEAMIKTYEAFGITMRNKSLIDTKNPTQYKPMPILGDLYEQIKKYLRLSEFRAGASGICAALQRYVDGSAKSFNAPTNVNLDNPYVVIDLSSMSKELMPVAIFIATDLAFDSIRADITTRKALIMDELSLLIGIAGTEAAAEFVLKAFKLVRAYNCIAIGATQDVNDFFALKDGFYGKGILANSKIQFLMRQKEQEAASVADLLGLSEIERSNLPFYLRGEALVLANRNHAKIKVVGSEIEHDLITTDASDLLAQIETAQNQAKEG